MSKLLKLEYRVKQKTVWFVTRYCEFGDECTVGGHVNEEGSFTDPISAQRSALALMEWDARKNGIEDMSDERLVWPEPRASFGVPQTGGNPDETSNA